MSCRLFKTNERWNFGSLYAWLLEFKLLHMVMLWSSSAESGSSEGWSHWSIFTEVEISWVRRGSINLYSWWPCRKQLYWEPVSVFFLWVYLIINIIGDLELFRLIYLFWYGRRCSMHHNSNVWTNWMIFFLHRFPLWYAVILFELSCHITYSDLNWLDCAINYYVLTLFVLYIGR